MAQKASRVFHSLEEFEAEAEVATKLAMQETAEELKEHLHQFVEQLIYNAYTPTFYERTNSLLDERAIEAYVYKNVKNAIGMGIRFNKAPYEERSNLRKFQHGNDIRHLEFGSFLEIMNDSSKLHENPYHFPTSKEIDRGNFYDAFKKYAEENYSEIFHKHFDWRMHRKPNLKGLGKGTQGNRGLSSSTRNIPSLDSGTTGLSSALSQKFTGTVSVFSETGELTYSQKY